MSEAEILQSAVIAHQSGRLADAEAGYRQLIARRPRHADALNLLGILLADRGERETALGLFERAIAANPKYAQVYFNKANVLAAPDAAERALDQAAAVYRKAINLKPDFADAWLNLGALLHRRGKLAEAKTIFRKMTKSCPSDPRGFFNLGRLLIDDKEPDQAIEPLTTAIKLAPAYAGAHLALSDAFSDLPDADKALLHLRTAAQLQPSSPDVLSRMPFTLVAAGQVVEALDAFAQAKSIFDDAPDKTQAFYIALGKTYHEQSQYRAALDAYADAARAASVRPEIPHNIGEVYADIGAFDQALTAAREASALSPEDGRFSYNIGLLNLKMGHLAEGWDLYEHRFYSDESDKKSFKLRYPEPPPYWNGEAAAGKRFFVWREQGIGDEILGAGALTDLIAQGADVTLICNQRLERIHRRSFPGIATDGVSDPRRMDKSDFDYQIALGSLGRFFRRDIASFPRHGGYLKADPAKVEALREKYRARAAGRRIVGISWRSKNEKFGAAKSARLADWRDILSTPETYFINLQYGDCREDLAAVKDALGVDVHHDADVDPMGDLDDFFAQVAAMDLVISTSNTTVHVAGAQNIPCWVMLPHGGGSMWYWFINRSDSPWYPSVRLYRQERQTSDIVPNDGQSKDVWWQGPMRHVAADLNAWIKTA